MDTTSPESPRFVRWAVVLGIIIILNVFFTVVRSLIFPEPVYPSHSAMTEASCTEQGGVWTSLNNAGSGVTIVKAPVTDSYCDFSATEKTWKEMMADFQLRGFIFMLVAGIIALVAGVLIVNASVISTGLSFGGVVAFIIGSIGYWNEADNWIRLAISLVALLALLYLAWKKFRD